MSPSSTIIIYSQTSIYCTSIYCAVCNYYSSPNYQVYKQVNVNHTSLHHESLLTLKRCLPRETQLMELWLYHYQCQIFYMRRILSVQLHWSIYLVITLWSWTLVTITMRDQRSKFGWHCDTTIVPSDSSSSLYETASDKNTPTRPGHFRKNFTWV